MKIHSVVLVILVLCLQAPALGSVKVSSPLRGTKISYDCTGTHDGPEEHRIVHSSGSLWGIQQISGISTSKQTTLSDFSPWQYLLRTPSFEETSDGFRLVKVKSGDFISLNNLEPKKTYTGILEILDSKVGGKPFDVKVTAEITTIGKEKTKNFRTQQVARLTARFENLDGKGGQSELQVEYLPSLRIINSETFKADDKIVRSCVANKISYSEQVRKSRNSILLKLPEFGSKLSYACTGNVQRLSIKMGEKNSKGEHQLMVEEFPLKKYSIVGQAWQIYANLGSTFGEGEIPKSISHVGGFDSLKYSQRPGSYVGGFNFLKDGKIEDSWIVKITLGDLEKMKSPYRSEDEVFEIRTTRIKEGDSIISKYYYSEKATAPYMFSISNAGTPSRTCWLASVQ